MWQRPTQEASWSPIPNAKTSTLLIEQDPGGLEKHGSKSQSQFLLSSWQTPKHNMMLCLASQFVTQRCGNF